ncbi:MAG: ammonium transporter [Maricaulaceae bacterium]
MADIGQLAITLGAAAPVDLASLAERVAQIEAESAYARNSFLLLISGMVVMFMAAGFCMLETGLVRQRNAATIALKNISLYSIAGLAFYLVGYELMFNIEEGGFLGTFAPFTFDPMDEVNGDYASGAIWFFQMAFVATAASIVSGALAERIKLWPFLIFVLVLTAIIYPIQGSWKWGYGWLDGAGFLDFAGSTIVHSVGGWAALVGAIILGAREGRFPPGRKAAPMPGSNLPLAALGTFILWLGWFGFNGGSQLAFDTPENVNSVARIMANTNTAAAAGVIVAMILTGLLYKKVDLTMALNGAIGGLVSITAEPLAPALWQAAIVGGIGGVIIVFGVPLLDRLRIDDVVGAIPAHLFCGIWGTLVVAWTNNGGDFFEQVGEQLLGIVAIGAFVSAASAAVWIALKLVLGIRASADEQLAGLDRAECGLEAYPEFAQN